MEDKDLGLINECVAGKRDLQDDDKKELDVFYGDTFVERRIHPRVPVKLCVKYQALEKYNADKINRSRSMNISATGLSLRSKQEMLVNETVTLQLFIPCEEKRPEMNMLVSCPEEDCEKITILSRVVWCRAGDDDTYIFGVEFLDVSLDDQDYVNRFLQSYYMPEPKAI